MVKSPYRLRDIAFLDIGSTKICCCIAHTQEDIIKVLGLGHYASAGIKAGQIVDVEAAQQAILRALEAAEEEAERTVHALLVAVPGVVLKTAFAEHKISIDRKAITDADIIRVLTENNPFEHYDNLEILHAIPLAYTVDEIEGIEDPRGMIGKELSVTAHFIAASRSVLNTLRVVISGCHLDCAGFVAAPYAFSLALLNDDELQLGVTVLDLGGQTSSFALFKGGVLAGIGAIPLGGYHVTKDLAYGLSTSLMNAERAKTVYGSCLLSSMDERELVLIPGSGDQCSVPLQQVQKSLLVRIVRPRIEEVLDLLRHQLTAFPAVFGRRLVLTGGGSQLPGVRDLTSTFLDKQVRMEKFQKILYTGDLSPCFSTVLGLVRYFIGNHQDYLPHENQNDQQEGFKGIWNWIKKNL
ncbi:MAG: cell division protein FtsA [Holosporales bacterium]|jgi:cell division protein FtsA|nr:cell division protein FtsA [Holosporales bacterium]